VSQLPKICGNSTVLALARAALTVGGVGDDRRDNSRFTMVLQPDGALIGSEN